MRALCVGRHRYLSDHLELFFTELGLETSSAVGLDEAVQVAQRTRPDVVIESVGGAADTLDDAVRVVGRGGRIVVLGTFSEPKPRPPSGAAASG